MIFFNYLPRKAKKIKGMVHVKSIGSSEGYIIQIETLFSNESPFDLIVGHIIGDPNSMISPVCDERTDKYTTLTFNVTDQE